MGVSDSSVPGVGISGSDNAELIWFNCSSSFCCNAFFKLSKLFEVTVFFGCVGVDSCIPCVDVPGVDVPGVDVPVRVNVSGGVDRCVCGDASDGGVPGGCAFGPDGVPGVDAPCGDASDGAFDGATGDATCGGTFGPDGVPVLMLLVVMLLVLILLAVVLLVMLLVVVLLVLVVFLVLYHFYHYD